MFVFSLLFALILAALLRITGGRGYPQGEAALFRGECLRGRICKIEDKNGKIILHLKCDPSSYNGTALNTDRTYSSYKVLVYLKDHKNSVKLIPSYEFDIEGYIMEEMICSECPNFKYSNGISNQLHYSP